MTIDPTDRSPVLDSAHLGDIEGVLGIIRRGDVACLETATQLPGGGHENCPLALGLVARRVRQIVGTTRNRGGGRA